MGEVDRVSAVGQCRFRRVPLEWPCHPTNLDARPAVYGARGRLPVCGPGEGVVVRRRLRVQTEQGQHPRRRRPMPRTERFEPPGCLSRAACPRHPCLTISKRRVRGGCPFVGSSSPSATAGSWFLPGVLVAPRWGDPFWGIVGMPTVLGHDSELSGRDHLDDLLARQPNCELRFALQDEEKLVTCAVALPWRTAAEGGHTAQAAVESEATYRTVGFCIQLREIESGHFANRIRAEVVDNHRAHLRHGVQSAPCGIPLVDHPRIRDHREASLITNDVVELP